MVTGMMTRVLYQSTLFVLPVGEYFILMSLQLAHGQRDPKLSCYTFVFTFSYCKTVPTLFLSTLAYNNTEANGVEDTFHYINSSLMWVNARSYCRDFYTDLALIGDSKEDHKVFSNMYNTAWFGLYRNS